MHGAAAAEGRPMAWDDVIREFVEPMTDSALNPDARNRAVYANLIAKYADCEREALARA